MADGGVCVCVWGPPEPDSSPRGRAGAGLSSRSGPSRNAAGVGGGQKHQLPLQGLRYSTQHSTVHWQTGFSLTALNSYLIMYFFLCLCCAKSTADRLGKVKIVDLLRKGGGGGEGCWAIGGQNPMWGICWGGGGGISSVLPFSKHGASSSETERVPTICHI